MTDASQADSKLHVNRAITGTPLPRAVEDEPEPAPIIKLVNAVFQEAIKARATAIHILPRKRAVELRLRVDGVMEEAMTVPKNLQSPLTNRLRVMADADQGKPLGQIEAIFNGSSYHFFVRFMEGAYGTDIVLRNHRYYQGLEYLNEMGMPEPLYQTFGGLLTKTRGLILFTAPPGHGLHTTLWICLKTLARPTIKSVACDRWVDPPLGHVTHVVRKGMSECISTALLHQPDLLVVDRIEDRTQAQQVFDAAADGRLVLAGLHAPDAPSSVSRLLSFGIDPHQVSENLLGVLNQRLVRSLCRKCSEEVEMTRDELAENGLPTEAIEAESVKVRVSRACDDCGIRGYLGQTALFEGFAISPELAQLIITRPSWNALNEAAQKEGMGSLKAEAMNKILSGATDVRDVRRVLYGTELDVPPASTPPEEKLDLLDALEKSRE